MTQMQLPRLTRRQFSDDLIKLERLLRTAVGQYEEGLPIHLSNSDKSAFETMSEHAFLRKSAGDIQEILRRKHILISDCEHELLKFDEDGLKTLCSPWQTIEVQGEV